MLQNMSIEAGDVERGASVVQGTLGLLPGRRQLHRSVLNQPHHRELQVVYFHSRLQNFTVSFQFV